MEFSKNEVKVLQRLRAYKLLSVACMALGGLGIPQGLWAILFGRKPPSEGLYEVALMGASLVVLGMGYLMFSFVRIIEKLQKGIAAMKTDTKLTDTKETGDDD